MLTRRNDVSTHRGVIGMPFASNRVDDWPSVERLQAADADPVR
jgi:hypothetical protein